MQTCTPSHTTFGHYLQQVQSLSPPSYVPSHRISHWHNYDKVEIAKSASLTGLLMQFCLNPPPPWLHRPLPSPPFCQSGYFKGNFPAIMSFSSLLSQCWCPTADDAETRVSSPGVQANAGGAFSPLLSVSIGESADSLHSPLDSGSYASADAARVGGGLYKHLLQAACTLATDPAPKVARIGKAALRVADVVLAPVPAPASKSLLCSLHSLAHQLSIGIRIKTGMRNCKQCSG